MKPGFKPRTINMIFAPVPAAKSRCLSAFVAIARQSLPITLRYEPSHLLALVGIILLILGFLTGGEFRLGKTILGAGWGFLIVAFLATISQDRLMQGKSRAKLIRQLDEVRRSTGLDEAILPESLDFLEATAREWERIEHALEAEYWSLHDGLRRKIYRSAHGAMEDIVVLECGSTEEGGLSDQEAEQTLTETAANLGLLADVVDAASAAMMSHQRDEHPFNVGSPDGDVLNLEVLAQAIERLERSRSQFRSTPSLHQG